MHYAYFLILLIEYVRARMHTTVRARISMHSTHVYGMHTSPWSGIQYACIERMTLSRMDDEAAF